VKAGLVKDEQEPIGLHDLRHSLAANSFALGLTDVEVARLLRHANPRVALTIYADLVEGGDVGAARTEADRRRVRGMRLADVLLFASLDDGCLRINQPRLPPG
jgi:integrase